MSTPNAALAGHCLLAALALLLTPAAHAQPASFQGLGHFPGGNLSEAWAVSADGSVVAGGSRRSDGTESFRWTGAGGMVGLGDLPGGNVFSFAFDVSADGSVVVGTGRSAGGDEAFRWTTTDGMTGLGHLPGGALTSVARAASADGSVVAGLSNSAAASPNLPEAFRWTAGGGMVGLGFLSGGRSSEGYDVSADGSVVVGTGRRPDGGREAFRWTGATGMAGLGDLPGPEVISDAWAVSADGGVVVGQGTRGLAGTREAFRWTADAGMVGLGFLNGFSTSTAFGTSADGAVVVGVSEQGAQAIRAFIWTSAEGMRDLNAVLIGLGVDLTGWQLRVARAVSADGSVVVGQGTNPQGLPEAWRAVLGTPVAGEGGPGLPAAALHAPAPNPASGRVALAFDLASAGPVRLAVLDVLGREVAVVVDGERPAGAHTATLDGARLPAGVYLVRLTTGGVTRTRRVTALR